MHGEFDGDYGWRTFFAVLSGPAVQADDLSWVLATVPVAEDVVAGPAVCGAGDVAVELVAQHAHLVGDGGVPAGVGEAAPHGSWGNVLGLDALLHESIHSAWEK